MSSDDTAAPDSIAPVHAALFGCLLWAVLTRDLETIVTAFGAWRDEERWQGNYCPTCGEAPAMAQLVGRDTGRLRLLSWAVAAPGGATGEPAARSAKTRTIIGWRWSRSPGKTVSGLITASDAEDISRPMTARAALLADWTSLHLDLLARDRGLKTNGGIAVQHLGRVRGRPLATALRVTKRSRLTPYLRTSSRRGLAERIAAIKKK